MEGEGEEGMGWAEEWSLSFPHLPPSLPKQPASKRGEEKEQKPKKIMMMMMKGVAGRAKKKGRKMMSGWPGLA